MPRPIMMTGWDSLRYRMERWPALNLPEIVQKSTSKRRTFAKISRGHPCHDEKCNQT